MVSNLVNAEHLTEAVEQKIGEYALIRDAENPQLSIYDKPLPCFGCGIGWFSLLLGFVFPLMWYYATILYFGNYYHKDPRERAGLAASAIAVSANLGSGMFDVMVEFSSTQGIDIYNCFDNHNSYSRLLVHPTAVCTFSTA
ncbi:hypothetical protein Godav_002096 [Gossypium davidsonii]|uniref:Uncharacterized protein n=2 Tax=Gossypium TaxID=3633 RepID=A0A7J8SV33_GOSDV|nr:hypothetical protein [Gossypium davidsonii]MBA0665652.1 hypothetical protein [Gossypium klotzschianum]